jgi:hypothetical protein
MTLRVKLKVALEPGTRFDRSVTPVALALILEVEIGTVEALEPVAADDDKAAPVVPSGVINTAELAPGSPSSPLRRCIVLLYFPSSYDNRFKAGTFIGEFDAIIFLVFERGGDSV